jgi:hypothetical protein
LKGETREFIRPAKKHLKNVWGGNVDVSCGKGLTQNELSYRSSTTDELILAAIPIDYVRVSPALEKTT